MGRPRYNGAMEKVEREKHTRDFKGVWIPKEIWLSDELSLMEKVLFVEISSLDNERGCFASNRYLSIFFGVSDRQIRRYIASLKSKGFITITILNEFDRVIRTAGRYRRVPDTELRRLETQGTSRRGHVMTLDKLSRWRRCDRHGAQTEAGMGGGLLPRDQPG
jgi:hypothetical protein